MAGLRMYRHTYRVRGRVAFPIDMLRYDQSFPAGESESGKIDRSLHHDLEKGAEIELATWAERRDWSPTFGRWDSYGWMVVEGSLKHDR